jgi:hypothetical protein
MIWLPDTMETYVLKINKDPEISRNQRMEMQSRAAEAAQAERMKQLQIEQLNRKVDSSIRATNE